MTGYIKERYGTYYLVIRYKDEDGKRKTKWISTGLPLKNNRKNAEKLLRDTLAEYGESYEKDIKDDDAGPESEMFSISFTDYIGLWLENMKKQDVLQPNTIQFYESMCKNHIIPYFKDRNLLLADVDSSNLQEFINYEKVSGNNSLAKNKKEGLSPSSLKHLRTTLTLIFSQARKERLIFDNPTEFLVIPKIQKRDVDFYTESEISELLEKIKDEEIYPVIYTTLFYGLRRSEVCGLKWDSVNTVNKTVTIKHTVVRFSDVIEKDTTKTESSHRTLPLSPEIEEIFIRQKEKEAQGRKKYGKHYVKNGYIFKKESGEMFTPDYVTRKFSQLLKKYGLRHIRFHDLRHSCASLLVSKGYQLKDIQEWLGHSDIQTTANIYAHLDQSRKLNIMSAMQNINKTEVNTNA